MHPRLLSSSIGFALICLASALPDAPAPGAPQVVDMGNGKILPIDAARLDAIVSLLPDLDCDFSSVDVLTVYPLQDAVNESIVST